LLAPTLINFENAVYLYFYICNHFLLVILKNISRLRQVHFETDGALRTCVRLYRPLDDRKYLRPNHCRSQHWKFLGGFSKFLRHFWPYMVIEIIEINVNSING